MTSLGIDIGGTSTKLALLEAGATRWTAQSRPYSQPTTAQLVAAIRETFSAHAVPVDRVGLCVPGILDAERRNVLLSVNVPGLMGLPLLDLVREALGPIRSVLVTSDTVATGVDVWRTRKLAGRLLVLCLGTGIGAAVLDDGAVLRVDGDTPGHIGQLDVSLEDDPVIGPDGGAGSLEGYIGAPALAQRYGRDFASAIAHWRGDEPPLRALARAIRICHAIYRPAHVCLAGGLGIRLSAALVGLKAEVDRNLTRIAHKDWSLFCGDNDFHAALGAARLACE